MKFKADGSLAARLCVDAGTSCPEGWTSASVTDCKDCPPYPVGQTPTGSAPDGSTIQTADDQRFKEWQECRVTIGRLDTILEDLRKTGFSIAFGLLTAGTLIGLLGVGSATDSPLLPLQLRATVFLIIMGLIAALFTIDSYYEVLLNGAVERALDLEVMTEPRVRLTRYLGRNVLGSRSIYGIPAAYLILMLAAYLPGRVMIELAQVAGPSGLASLYENVSLFCFGYVIVYFAWTGWGAKLFRFKPTRHWPEDEPQKPSWWRRLLHRL